LIDHYIRFAKENLVYTADSELSAAFMLQMMGVFAEFERLMIRARQKKELN